ncbi:hypothetical protein B5C34_05320 [Pacificimonas flava]|uniref:Regulatory protein GemA n=2 Tax=Pacificimonas TaxID=1960290 RepID=A0A219B3H6_9SPHN|nr:MULTISPECIES: regulatory protein GemA [Pacificimonas]MBZ6377360.1 regulatory protein GemA [Pacificimonas aurantium]OWV32932.1 hypothetical protein B5C34_05320 [Pacificimonas flava]
MARRSSPPSGAPRPSGRSADPRKRMIQAVMATCRRRGIDDEARYALIERLTGKRSSRALTVAELKRVLDDLKRDERKAAPRPAPYAALHRKISALWWSCYWLGALDVPPDAQPVDAFVRRQAKVDSLRFVTHREAPALIEALKAIAARYGVRWLGDNDTAGDALAERRAVAVAIGERLAALRPAGRGTGRQLVDPIGAAAFKYQLPLDRESWGAAEWDLVIQWLGERHLRDLKVAEDR